jgi:V8-like Glu-specific endopeptidase
MKRETAVRCTLATLALLLVGAGAVAAQNPSSQKVKIGHERAYAAEVRYERGHGTRPAVDEQWISSPGAQFVRVHFTGMDLKDGDFLTVAHPDGRQNHLYTQRGPNGNGSFWSFYVDGDTAVVSLHAGAQPGKSFRVDKVAHGEVSLEHKKGDVNLEVVCGTDGREDAACHAEVNTNPVARLLFQQGGSTYLCTGSLVAGSNGSTMLTNNHCFSTQTGVNTVQANFNYQYSSCNGGTLAGQTNYAGGTFLKTNSVQKKGKKGGLDYTLFTLQGNPEATWGEYTATTKAATVGLNIFFPQHPAGRPKEIGYYEDSVGGARCNVDTINATYGTAAAASQTGYACDSEGGSSGSPILDATTGRVIALHHYGGVSSSPCLNSGTQMSKVCADAGSLLACASN